LAENNNIAGYKLDKTNHRRLFYKIAKMMMEAIHKICLCNTREEVISLNFLSELKFGKAGRPKTEYKPTKIDDTVVDSISYDEIIVNL
jgi:hypothetical protein